MSLLRPILRPLFESLPKELGSHTLDLDFIGSGAVDPRITFTRASTAMRTNPAGVLESVAVNVPRIDYDPVTLQCRGLLREGARTNLLTYSDGIGTTPWSTVRCSVVSATAYGAAPMFKIVEDTSASTTHSIGRVSAGNVSWVSGKTYTFSILVKKSERDGVRLSLSAGAFGANIYAQFNLLTGGVVLKSAAITAHAKYIGADLWRLGISATATATSTAPINVFLARDAGATLSYTGDGSSGIYVGAPQVEEGEKMSSYIPTSSAIATRSADLVTLTGSDFTDWYNATAGTFLLDADCDAGSAKDSSYLSVSDGSSANYMSVIGNVTDYDISLLSYVGGSSVVDSAKTPNGVYTQSGEVFRAAMAYAVDDVALASHLGGTLSLDSSAAIPTVDRLIIGAGYVADNRPLFGHIRRLTYFPKRLPNSTLQMLSRAP